MTFEPTGVGTRVQFDAHGRTSGPMPLAELFLRLTLALDLTAATASGCWRRAIRRRVRCAGPAICFWRPYAQVRHAGERAESIGATLTVESAAGRGTTVRLAIP